MKRRAASIIFRRDADLALGIDSRLRSWTLPAKKAKVARCSIGVTGSSTWLW